MRGNGHSWTATVVVLALALAAACDPASHGARPSKVDPAPEAGSLYRGASDASAAVAIDAQRILVADDETNVLRLFAVEGGRSLAIHDLTTFLAVGSSRSEADLEGAARVGDRVYWISSHGRSRRGRHRPNRDVLFATDLEVEDAGPVAIRDVGAAFHGLLDALAGDPRVAGVPLDGGGTLGGEIDRLNVEGLAGTPDEELFIGLREPLAEGHDGGAPRAIVVPLDNPREVVEEAAAPRLGEPLLLDLGGGGIRSLLWSSDRARFLVVAGGPRRSFSLWAASRDGTAERLETVDSGLPDWKPEALVELPGGSEALVLSDDGGLRVPATADDCEEGEWDGSGTCENKRLRDPDRRTFRGSRVALPVR